MICRGCRLQCWSIDVPLTESRMPWDIFKLFQPWICRELVEVVYDDFGAEAWSFSWKYGWAGLQFLFRSKSYFYFLFSRQCNCDLLPQCCWPFWLSAFHWPWHWGLILNANLPGIFLMLHHQQLYMAGTCAHWQMMRYVCSPHFPYTLD